MRSPHVLIVEDEPKTAETVRLYLERAGYAATVERSGRAGLAAARSGAFALVILDLMLPEIDGLTVCRRLRAETDARILMLTARSTEDDKVRGLELGADDYVSKPFSPRELVARVRAVLRRGAAGADRPQRLRHLDLELDRRARRVRVGGRDARLTATELELLATLVESPGRVFTRAELIERALGSSFAGSDRTVDAHIRNLRAKIETPGEPFRYIETVFGIGYRTPEADAPEAAVR